MRNLRIIYTSAILLSLATVGCKKSFLEITPAGSLVAQKTSDYDLMLNNTNTLGNQAMTYNQSMGDEMAGIEPYYTGATLQQQRSFQWADNIYEPNENAPETQYPTAALYVYNVIINEVPNSTGGTDAQKNSIRAEALAGRAWTYLQLINTFGKPYSPASAATDPGFPIITEANVTAKDFKRASVKEVYDFIIKDLKDAIPFLSATPVHRFRMSRPAAEALLAKTYLFMGLFNEALPHINNAMTDIASSTYAVRLYDYNVTFAPGGQFTPVSTFGPVYPNYLNNEESLYSRQTFGDWTGGIHGLVLSPETMNLYGASDLRRNFMSSSPFPSGTLFPLGMYRRTGPFSPITGMVLPDVYLMSAEIKARLNDLTGAKQDVEALRIKRMPASDATVPSGIANDRIELVKFILEERIREFSAFGYRWFDMRRLSVDPEFSSTINHTHTVYAADGTVSTTYTLKPERFTFKIPPKIILENPGMENNP